jgi:hypothetical protein
MWAFLGLAEGEIPTGREFGKQPADCLRWLLARSLWRPLVRFGREESVAGISVRP